MIVDRLIKQRIPLQTARMIAAVATLNGVLPQGAPTSPQLSNLVLFDFDRSLLRVARERNLSYTRYADDITLSGNDLIQVREAIQTAEMLLKELGLVVNNDKTRIISRGGQQRVTGVVVNEKPQPPRKLRRRVRAMFHNALKNPTEYKERIAEMRGYLSYFASYPELANQEKLDEYRAILKQLNT